MADIRKQERVSQQFFSNPNSVVSDLANISSALAAQRAPRDTTPLPAAPILQALPAAPATAPLSIFDRIASTLAASGGGGASAPNFSPSIGVTGALGLEGFQALSGIRQAEASAALGQDQLTQRRAESAQEQSQFEQTQAVAAQSMQNRVAEANWKNQMSLIRFKKELTDATPQELAELDVAHRAYLDGKRAAGQLERQRELTAAYGLNRERDHELNILEIQERAKFGGSSAATGNPKTELKKLLALEKSLLDEGRDAEATALGPVIAQAMSSITGGGYLGEATGGAATTLTEEDIQRILSVGLNQRIKASGGGGGGGGGGFSLTQNGEAIKPKETTNKASIFDIFKTRQTPGVSPRVPNPAVVEDMSTPAELKFMRRIGGLFGPRR